MAEHSKQQVDPQAPTVLPQGVKLLHTLKGHNHNVNGVAFDPRGGIIASGSADETVKLWEVRSGKLIPGIHRSQVAIDKFCT